MQCLLLADGKHPPHQNHVVVLPGSGGGGTAAISFVGALKIPVSTGPGRAAERGVGARRGSRPPRPPPGSGGAVGVTGREGREPRAGGLGRDQGGARSRRWGRAPAVCRARAGPV